MPGTTNSLYHVERTTHGDQWGITLTPTEDHTARLLLTLTTALAGGKNAGLRALTNAGRLATTDEVAAAVGGYDSLRALRAILTVDLDADTRVDGDDPDDNGDPLLLTHRDGDPARPAAEPRDCVDCGAPRTSGSVLCQTCLDRADTARELERAAQLHDQDLTYRIGA